MNEEYLKRIAESLERIASSLQGRRDNKGNEKPRSKSKPASPTNHILGTFVESYKERYGTTPVIDGKTAGLAKNLAKAIPQERLEALIQAYLQMDDAWFKTKCHDFATFAQNIQKVAVALANGTQDPHEKENWLKTFGSLEGFGGPNGPRGIQCPVQETNRELRGKELLTGTVEPILDSVPELPRG